MQEALSLYRDVGDRRGEAKVHNNLGPIHLSNGYHRDALDAYQKSLQIFREIGGPQNEAILHHNIGSVHRYKGSYSEALAACRQALTIYRDIGDLPGEAEVLNDIGAIYQSVACYDEALVHHERARLIAEDIGNLSQQLIALRLIADIYRGSGRYGEALEHYHAALRLVARDRRPVRGRQDPRRNRGSDAEYPAVRQRADCLAAGPGHLRTARRAGGRVSADTHGDHRARLRRSHLLAGGPPRISGLRRDPGVQGKPSRAAGKMSGQAGSTHRCCTLPVAGGRWPPAIGGARQLDATREVFVGGWTMPGYDPS